MPITLQMKLLSRLGLVTISVVMLIACHSSSTDSPRYKYLQQGQTQIRVDERSGRTDRLTNGGWIPMSFDSPSVDVPKDELKHVSVSIVANDIFDQIASPICYTVDNDSNFVLKEIWIELPVNNGSTSGKNKVHENAPLLLPLSSRTGGFAPVGNKFEMCYDSKQDLSNWDTLLAVNSAQGWKQ